MLGNEWSPLRDIFLFQTRQSLWKHPSVAFLINSVLDSCYWKGQILNFEVIYDWIFSHNSEGLLSKFDTLPLLILFKPCSDIILTVITVALHSHRMAQQGRESISFSSLAGSKQCSLPQVTVQLFSRCQPMTAAMMSCWPLRMIPLKQSRL